MRERRKMNKKGFFSIGNFTRDWLWCANAATIEQAKNEYIEFAVLFVRSDFGDYFGQLLNHPPFEWQMPFVVNEPQMTASASAKYGYYTVVLNVQAEDGEKWGYKGLNFRLLYNDGDDEYAHRFYKTASEAKEVFNLLKLAKNKNELINALRDFGLHDW